MSDANSRTVGPRLLAISMLVTAMLLLGIGATGCGGGSDEKQGERAESEQPNGEESGEEGGEEGEQAQAQALAKIPPADRTAFFRLATAIGTLRARAAPVAVGSSTQLTSAAGVRAARAQVAGLHPKDHQLRELRDHLVPVLGDFARAPTSGPAARRAARAAVADADRIEAGLRDYTKRIPAIGGAIPD